MPDPVVSAGSAPGLTRHTLDFTHVTTDNRQTRLSFNVETDAKVIAPEMHPEVLGLKCNDTHVAVNFGLNETVAKSLSKSWPTEGAILSVHSAWGCGESLRWVASPWTLVNNSILMAETTAANFYDIFANAQVHYSSNHTAEGEAMAPVFVAKTAKTASTARVNRRGLLGDLWNGAVNAVDSVASTATAIVNDAVAVASTVGTAVTAMATGSLQYDGVPFNHDWPIPVASGANSDNSFNYNLGADITLTSHVEISVQDYTLQNVLATVTASGSASASVNLNANQALTWTSDPTSVFDPTTIVSITIMIGPLPISVSIIGSATAKAYVNAAGSAVGGASYQAACSLTAGAQFTPGSPISWIDTPSYSFTQNPPTMTASGAVATGVTITPQITLSVAHIGGPVISAPLALTAAGSFGQSAPANCPNGQYELDALVSVNLGAALDVEVLYLGCSILWERVGPSSSSYPPRLTSSWVQLLGMSLYKNEWPGENVLSQTYPIIAPTCF